MIEQDIHEQNNTKSYDVAAEILCKTNAVLQNKFEFPRRYLPNVADEIPVVQEEVVETTSDQMAGGYYEMEEVAFYNDLNQMRTMEARPSAMMPNYQLIEESDYPHIPSRVQMLENPNIESTSRTIFYVIPVGSAID